MDTISSQNEVKAASADMSSTNSQSASADKNRRAHQFQPGLGDHSLWPAFMEELKKQREADIIESNRLADLELAELEQK